MSNFGTSQFGLPRPGPAISALMILNVAVFLVNLVLGGRLSEGADGMWFAVGWSQLWEGYGLGLLRLLSYQFTHAYSSPMHLLFNMLALYAFGNIAEGALGYSGTIKLYLAGGIAAAFVHMLIYGLMLHASVPVVGASGSCFALMVFATCVAPRAVFLLFLFPVPLIFLCLLAVGLALYSLLVELRSGTGGGVSDSAHLGGAAFGYLAYRLQWFRDYRTGNPLRQLFDRLRAMRSQRQAQHLLHEQQQLDLILAKVKEQGLPALTRGERAFLDRMSQRGRKS